MGGFHLFKRSSKETNNVKPISHEKDTPLHPLAAIDLYGDNPTLDIGFSSFYVPTEAEIKDKGKSDWLAKSLVLLQTSWFVMQCIARAIDHLPVTHLEIVTLAYATMNFVIYIFWWNKPLNVNRPVRVFQKPDPRAADNGIDSHGAGPSEIQSQQISEGGLSWEVTTLNFIVGTQDEDIDLSHEDRVPRFWTNSNGEDAGAAGAIVLWVGVLFGAIHCIAWSFSFPTHVELLIWRISSVAVTVVPSHILLMLFLTDWLKNTNFNATLVIVSFSILPAGMLYILARAVTLILVFTSLRDLPPGAFNTVYWTTFIPHI